VVKKGLVSGLSDNRINRISGEIIKAQHIFQDLHDHSTMDRVIFSWYSGKRSDNCVMVCHSVHGEISSLGFLLRFRIRTLVCPGAELLLSTHGQVPAF
jgi:hypothetical protein